MLHKWYYDSAMDTISLKLPTALLAEVEAEASARSTSKSAVIRESLEHALRKGRRHSGGTCLDLMGDLFASQPGPRDASTHTRYLKGFGRGRKATR